MADSIFDFDPVAANNTSFAGTPYGPNQLYHNQIDNLFRAYAGALGGFVDDLGAVATPTGSATAVAVTLSQGFTAYGTGSGEIRHGTLIALKMPWAATAAATLAINAIAGTKKIRRQGDSAIEANDWIANGIYFFRYDTAYDSATGAWVLMNAASSGVTFATNAQAVTGTSTVLSVNPANLLATRQLLHAVPFNLGIAASVGSSALTIALKGADGNDPSATNPVEVPFRNVTPGTGTPSVLSVTAATSLVITSGSTLGAPTGSVPFKVWVVGFNDAGTLRLGVILATTLASSALTIYPLAAYGIASSTAEGAAGGADTAQTFYTGTAVTSKAYTVLAVLHYESGLATAGTWASAPTRVQLFDASVPLPGRVVQNVGNQTGAVATGTTVVPLDDTIPQSGEGNQYLSQAITPSSAANILKISSKVHMAHSASGTTHSALFQDATAGALSVGTQRVDNVNLSGSGAIIDHKMIAATTSATTFKVRGGSQTAGTTTFNGASSARLFGGVINSFLFVEEVSA